MRLPLPCIALLLGAVAPVRGAAQNLSIPKTPVGTMDAADVQATLDGAALVDSVAAAELAAAVQSGQVQIGKTLTGLSGTHDHDTIAVDPMGSPVVRGIAALHEWVHVKNCNGGPGAGGTVQDGRVLTEGACYKCTHAQMNIDSAVAISNWLCDRLSIYGPHDFSVDAQCAILNDVVGAAVDQAALCPSTCGNQPVFPSPPAAIDACGACP